MTNTDLKIVASDCTNVDRQPYCSAKFTYQLLFNRSATLDEMRAVVLESKRYGVDPKEAAWYQKTLTGIVRLSAVTCSVRVTEPNLD